MIDIKISMKIVMLSILIAIFMYPNTVNFLVTSGENMYTAYKLNTGTIENSKFTVASDKAKIVFMFDDGWKSVYTGAYEIMSKYGYTGCVSIVPSLVDEKEYIPYRKLSELYLKGWDLLNHSYSHKENTYDNSDELLSDFNKARQWMKNRYIGDYSNMAVLPYGEINPYLIRRLKDAGYSNARTSDNIIILNKNVIEYYPVTTITLLTDVTVDEVKNILTQKYKEPKPFILVLHKIEDRNDGSGMTYSKDKLEEIIVFINSHSDKFEVINYSQLFN